MSTKGQEITVKSLLRREDYQNRFKEILGARAAQFTASVVNLSRDQNIADCEPGSVLASAVIAATLDLPVDRNLGFCWIVPYRLGGGQKVATFQMGYKGFVQLALRTSQYAGMNAVAVNKECYKGKDGMGRPKIDWDAFDDTKPVAGYVFAFALVNSPNSPWLFYWSKEKVQAHAERYSQSYRSGRESPWKTHFDAMALKTVIKNELSDWGILSIELQRAMVHDQGAQVDIESEVVYVDREPAAVTSGQGGEGGDKKPGEQHPPPHDTTKKPAAEKGGEKRADVSDLHGDDAPPGAEVPAKATTQQAAPTQSEPSAPPVLCLYCSQPFAQNHGCPGLAEAKQTKAQLTERTGPPAQQEQQEATERGFLLDHVGKLLAFHQITGDQLLDHLRSAKTIKRGQALKDLGTAKLRGVDSGLLLDPDTVLAIKQVPAQTT